MSWPGAPTEIADRTGDANSALLARVASLRAHPRDAGEQLALAAALHADALTFGNRWAGLMSAGDAVRACLADDNVDAALEWSQRGMEDYLALGAKDSPQFVELHGALHARRGDYRSAVRLLGAAREQNRRAAMRWPARPQTRPSWRRPPAASAPPPTSRPGKPAAGCTWPISRGSVPVPAP